LSVIITFYSEFQTVITP